MTDTLTLSVIIPAYNEERHIGACLDALAAQSRRPHQVVVVDNNSTDKTAEIARKYDFVTVIHEPRQGISNAHHAGFAAATGSLIARIDADSLLPADWAERILLFYDDNRHKATALTGSGFFKNVRARRLHPIFVDSMFVLARLMLGHVATWGPNTVIPRSEWDKISDKTCVEKPTTYDDLDIALHLHAEGVPIVWMRSLRVGVRLKHIGRLAAFWCYVHRWSGTLRNHGDWRWPIAWAGEALAVLVQYPALRILRDREADES